MPLGNLLLVAGGVLVVVVVAAAVLFNKLVRLRQNVRESWSAVDTELQRRHDLIPGLVETVRGYARHEQFTLESVIEARSLAENREGDLESLARKETRLTGELRKLLAVVEAYPELKAADQFAELQSQLVETEDRLSKARRFYNANVRAMNTAVGSVPTNILARAFKFTAKPYFEADVAAHTAPDVNVSS